MTDLDKEKTVSLQELMVSTLAMVACCHETANRKGCYF